MSEDDDFLTSARKARGTMPPAEYVAEIVPGSATPVETAKTHVVSVIVKITEGDYRGREVRLRFLEVGPASLDSLIARDLETLFSWREAVKGEPSPREDGIVGVLKAIWKASKGKRVLLRLGARTAKDGAIETILLGARLEDACPF
jgi:hypothetical protein